MPTTKRNARSTRSGQKPLSLNAVIPLAQSLAAKETHRTEDIDDLVQVGLFAYHKATHRKKLTIDKPHAFARTVLQRAMRGYYWQQREWQTRGEPNKAVGLDKVNTVGQTLSDSDRLPPMLIVGLDGRQADGEQVELLEFDDYFNALERKCGATARLMVENLLMPSGECCGRILDEVRGKQAEQQKLGKRAKAARRHQPRGVKKEIRISHRIVRDALGISPTEWVRHMNAIKEFTEAWIGR